MSSAGAAGPVAVVGAGPVGMTVALFLARFGVAVVLLEAAERPSGEGSRSICVQRDVLELFERVGCGREMADRGVSWTLGRTYFRGTELFQIRFPAAGRDVFPPFVNLPQVTTEQILLDRVVGSDLVEVRRGHRVEGLEQDDRGVALTLATPSGPASLRAPYVVACDGPRSSVRRLLGVEFGGHSHHDRFLIADVRAKLPFPDERRFFFDPPFNPGRQVLVHPQPDDVWRIDWQVPGDVDAEEEAASGRLDRRVRAIVGDAPYELVWLSVYRFHQRVAARFRVGRVLLAGDAAHLMSPFGARGLNSGVADAENAAWKLWLVLAGRTPDRLLDTYHDERHAAAVHNLAVTDATMRFMVPASPAARLLRDAVLRGSLRSRALRRYVDSGQLSQPYVYAGSPIVPADRPSRAWARRPGRRLRRLGRGRSSRAAPLPTPGAVAPDGPCAPAAPPEGAGRLRELFGAGFVGLYFPPGHDAARRFAERALASTPGPPARLYVVAAPGEPLPDLPPGVTALVDTEGVLAATYAPEPDAFYLVRPDGHLAVRRRHADGADFAALVAAAAGGPPRGGGNVASSQAAGVLGEGRVRR